MKFWETLGVVGVAVVTLAACAGALRDLVKIPGQLWRIFGWHGRFWAYLVRLVRTVDVILSIPARLDRNEQLLAAHIAQAAPQVVLLEDVAAKVALLPGIASMTTEVVGQVKNNGGSSLLDSTHRIEEQLGLPTPAKNRPITGPIPTTEEP